MFGHPHPDSTVLYRSESALYCIAILEQQYVLIAGGGGAGRAGGGTGVPNRIEIFSIDVNVEAGIIRLHPAGPPVENGRAAVNTLSINAEDAAAEEARVLLMCDHDRSCKVYALQPKVIDLSAPDVNTSITSSSYATDADQSSEVRQRRKHSKDGGVGETEKPPEQLNGVGRNLRLGYECLPHLTRTMEGVSGEKNYIQAVRFLPNHLCVAASTDGYVRVWSIDPRGSGGGRGRKQLEICAYDDGDMSDMDVSRPEHTHIVTLRGHKVRLFLLSNGKKVAELPESPPKYPRSKYKYKVVRYTGLGRGGMIFMTVSVPTRMDKRGNQCFVSQWIQLAPNAATKSPDNQVEIEHLNTYAVGSKQLVCSMSVSDDGLLTAIGTTEGSIEIFETIGMRLLQRYHNVHQSVVTGMTFMPRSNLKPQAMSYPFSLLHRAALLSVSADRQVQLHTVPHQTRLPVAVRLLLIVLPILCLSITLGALGL